jgi:hypothetical protein
VAAGKLTRKQLSGMRFQSGTGVVKRADPIAREIVKIRVKPKATAFGNVISECLDRACLGSVRRVVDYRMEEYFIWRKHRFEGGYQIRSAT